MKKIILSAIVIIFSVTGFCQPGFFYVHGKVIDKNSKAPMQSASVFAQYTTIGTPADAQGNFTLQLPNGGYDLIVTFTGYTTETRRISSADTGNNNIVIEITQKDKAMEAVSIVASNEVKDGWERYGFFFTDNFIGKTLFSSDCHILNKDVLRFFFSKKRNRLKVLASAPLEIINDALGYKIKYALDSFTYEYGSQITLFTGYPLFEEMQPANDAQQQRWHVNRMQAYNGSILHFMRSVYNKALKENGFEIQFLVKDADGRDTAIQIKDFYGALNYHKDDSSKTVDMKPNQKDMAVIYGNEQPEKNYLAEVDDAPKKYELSIITLAQPVTIEQNGYYYDQNDITINGYWTWEKVGDMVPYDFNPD
jgi:hypothetical protein